MSTENRAVEIERRLAVTHNLKVKLTYLEVGQWKPMLDLPNVAGYTFLAAMKDGTVQRKAVIRDSQGGFYTVENYSEILAWTYAQ